MSDFPNDDVPYTVLEIWLFLPGPTLGEVINSSPSCFSVAEVNSSVEEGAFASFFDESPHVLSNESSFAWTGLGSGSLTI